MAAQGERELGGIVTGEGLLDPMAQDEEIEQEMLGVEEERFIPPQMDPEPEMGAAAAEAAVYDTSPSLPHQNPSPIPAETAQPGTFDLAQLVAILAGMRRETREMKQEMKEEIKNNANGMKQEMKEEIKNNTKGMREQMKAMRGEMRQVGQCLQAGTRATPSAATNELRGSAPAGADRVSRETCRVTEKVKVTITREKLNGVTETCTREVTNAVTEIKCTAGREVTELTETREITREVVERLHGVEVKDVVGDAHTHTRS